MRSCDQVHREYDKQGNGPVQIGMLPQWMHVNGRVVWYVFQGPCKSLLGGWNEFMKKIRAMPTAKLAGAPGDVYACSPDDHAGDEKSIITILSAPVAD